MGAQSFLTELQRRHVFRALVGYVIAAFAVLQIVEPVMHGLHWSEEVLSYVVVAPAYGPAWSGLSLAGSLLSDLARERDEQRSLQQQALAAANKRSSLRPNWPRAGPGADCGDWKWAGIGAALRRTSIARSPYNPADISSNEARARVYGVLGHLQEAIASTLRTTELDRLNAPAWLRLFLLRRQRAEGGRPTRPRQSGGNRLD